MDIKTNRLKAGITPTDVVYKKSVAWIEVNTI